MADPVPAGYELRPTKTYTKDAYNTGVILAFVCGGIVGFFVAFLVI